MPILQEWKPSDILPSTVYLKKVFSKSCKSLIRHLLQDPAIIGESSEVLCLEAQISLKNTYSTGSGGSKGII